MTTSQLPTFLTRLFRPFTTSTRLSLNPSDTTTTTTTSQPSPANAQKATVAAG
ncbi:MAG: hypothetical protein M1835_001002, partial [Candelina submexicana]